MPYWTTVNTYWVRLAGIFLCILRPINFVYLIELAWFRIVVGGIAHLQSQGEGEAANPHRHFVKRK